MLAWVLGALCHAVRWRCVCGAVCRQVAIVLVASVGAFVTMLAIEVYRSIQHTRTVLRARTMMRVRRKATNANLTPVLGFHRDRDFDHMRSASTADDDAGQAEVKSAPDSLAAAAPTTTAAAAATADTGDDVLAARRGGVVVVHTTRAAGMSPAADALATLAASSVAGVGPGPGPGAGADADADADAGLEPHATLWTSNPLLLLDATADRRVALTGLHPTHTRLRGSRARRVTAQLEVYGHVAAGGSGSSGGGGGGRLPRRPLHPAGRPVAAGGVGASNSVGDGNGCSSGGGSDETLASAVPGTMPRVGTDASGGGGSDATSLPALVGSEGAGGHADTHAAGTR